MKIVKGFYSHHSAESLADNINTYLSNNPESKLIDIKYQTTSTSPYNNGSYTQYSALVIMEAKEK